VADSHDKPPRKLELAASDTLAAAAERALALGLAGLKHQERLAASGDVEGLHQLRVATRRVRASIELFASILHATQVRIWQRDLPWLAALAGAVRECDVIAETMRQRAPKIDPKLAESLQPIYDALIERRAEEHHRLAEALASERYRALLARLERPALRKAGAHSQLGPHAPRLVRPMVTSVFRTGTRLKAGAPPEVVHHLRVRVKRLRYALEMLASFGGKRHKKAVRRLEDLQDLLGTFNDVTIAIGWLIAYGETPGVAPAAALAAGAMVQSLRARERKLARRSLKAWRKFERSAIIRDALDEIRSNARPAPEPAAPATESAA
jgi:CHAD domain-containing protein